MQLDTDAMLLICTIIFSCVGATWTIKSSIDNLRNDMVNKIATIEKDYVTHEVCEKRRARCNCSSEAKDEEKQP